MEGRCENTKKEPTASRPLKPLVPLSLPLFAPISFPIPSKPYSFENHVNRFEPTIPFSASLHSQDLSSQHDDVKYSINCINTDNAMKVEIESTDGCNQLQPNMDPKKLKRGQRKGQEFGDIRFFSILRIISNRISAQKSRMKKIQYVSEMERKAKALEAKIAVLHPQVVMYRNKQFLLEMEQKMLSHEISASKSKKLLKDGEIEENRAELNRLRNLYSIQEGEKCEGENWNDNINNNNSTKYKDSMVNLHQEGGGLEGENIGSEWREEAESGEIWMPSIAAALMEDCSSNFMGIDQILNP